MPKRPDWLFVLLAAITCGCVSAPADGGAGGESGGECDDKGDCDQCSQCAAQVACAGLISACTNDAACNGLDGCLGLCGADVDCKNDCVANNPGGVAAYDAAQRCVYCQQCADDCAGFRACD